ncbi:N-acetylmuramoyl-L-alanine amidase [Kaistella jeonii]|uniref:N-acetylmuramoyl-L-alanine amidase n=1 Tax=Kaistella jeonii TaxID=266749 RepID=A0A0C1CWV7_9FLAO|nr:N-acetylmuramoyl-L-alanine amidase [Kaistella jeonii]KIA88856.1 N-acetylmuramoyl-L-alanine amidase [Kaistella jeonii]SFC13088.1 N-acetylmuramoyl-L-alanine amidase [Kaistella jeonii]VEI94470.1 N-acetylmuramoyl-L-alanine amidase AmiD precursor [Kaistella jeonii]
MRKPLYIISLSFLIISCGTQKNIQKVVTKPTLPKNMPANPAVSIAKSKILHEGGVDFYKENIADGSKNDNTISYGSIVSANPNGYKVVKTYYPSIGQNFRQKYIILHYTALDDDKSVAVLTQQSVSAHYLVNNLGDREIYQLVDENKRAYHAGISAWRTDKMLNDTSIGIEIVNSGYKTDSTGLRVFPEYDDAQVLKIAALVKDIANRYMIPATNILGHSDIAPTRKQDPGPKFPWKKLYNDYQLGMWYDEATKQNFFYQIIPETFVAEMSTAQSVFKYQTALKTLGYGLEPSGMIDDATKKTIEAFQYHFRPEKYDGLMDAETWSILQALNQKYPNK